MRARVALATTSLARGGAETQVVQLAIGLRARGWETSVISLVEPAAFVAELAQARVPVHSLGMQPGVANPRGYIRLLGLLRGLRPQILHSHLFHANQMARLARLLCPVPGLISTLHSVAESGRASRNIFWRDCAYRVTDPFGDVTVAVAEAVARRHAAARAVPQRKLRVIPNGVDTGRFRPDAARRERVRRSLGLGPEFVWLAAGRLMWKKGYETLLDAFDRCPKAVLLIAGTGPEEDELRRRAGASVRFLGERDDVADLMCAGDGFVQSSLVEGLPMALLEAASSGLPCVAADTGGVAEVGAADLVSPGNAEALARAMTRIMALSAEERQGMGLTARAQVVARFEASIVLTRWEELYREMLAPWM